ncbi:MAG: TRAP transporter small permease subunit [Acidovorax sp.]|nr:TRAP transporter small permease subunit [Acidovorax sp.]MDP3229290.1 TRAP transporter small permease subunit [Acidovorax sp.]
MQALLKFSRAVDWLSNGVGKLSMWLILATTLISAGNAVVRKAFNISSNALLEIQWYLFAGVFMLGAGYCLLKNAHVRIDFIASRLSARTRNWIDIIGILVVLFPFCLICIDLGWPLFVRAWESGEMSQSAGGLVRWPAYALIPLGFALLLLQGVSELIKRIAFLRGVGPDTLSHDDEPSEEEQLAAAMAAQLERESQVPTPSKAG